MRQEVERRMAATSRLTRGDQLAEIADLRLARLNLLRRLELARQLGLGHAELLQERGRPEFEVESVSC